MAMPEAPQWDGTGYRYEQPERFAQDLAFVQSMLYRYIRPHVMASESEAGPTVLIVGMEDRIAEPVAAIDVLRPQEVMMVDTAITRHTMNSFWNFMQAHRPGHLQSTITQFRTMSVLAMSRPFDIVVALNLSELLLEDWKLQHMHMIARTHLLITSYNSPAVTFDMLSIPDYMDREFAAIRLPFIERRVPISRGPADSHLWTFTGSDEAR